LNRNQETPLNIRPIKAGTIGIKPKPITDNARDIMANSKAGIVNSSDNGLDFRTLI